MHLSNRVIQELLKLERSDTLGIMIKSLTCPILKRHVDLSVYYSVFILNK